MPEEPAAAFRGVGRALWLSLREARPQVQVIFVLRFATAAALALLSGAAPGPAILAGAAAWFLLTWAIYLVNGIGDIVEDRANGSTRPIARGDLSPATAWWIAGGLAVAGMALAAAVSPLLALLGSGQLLLGWAYSMGPAPLKRVTVQAVVAVVLAGLLTYAAGVVSAGGRPERHLLVFPLMMALWMAVGGVTKDLSDVPGDRLAGRRTLPILLGERRARRVMALVAGAVAGGFVVLAADSPPTVRLASWLVLLGAVVLAWVVCAPAGRDDAFRRRWPYRIFMATQYIAHISVLLRFASA
ncbi:UbiA family prenyltransferase [Actinoplanes sp. NPDC049668]|uniref:UbiA family prenyltransferase n=1 Tax=unclassified Actinoplanes TaxID=2626549 RepID=UPI0033AD4FF8